MNMSDTTTTRRTPSWLVTTIAGFFGLFYAYAVWSGVNGLVQEIDRAGALGFGLNALGWFIWIFAALFPILVFAAAFSLGRRRPVHHLFLVMLTGLAVVAVFWLNVTAYTAVNTASLLA